jgi:uncharacterized protein (TIGR03437 family)
MRNYFQNCSILLVLATVPAFCAPPSIQAGGVVSASAFGQFKSIAPGSWIEIYGANLATGTRMWGGSDFNGSTAPTSLDGTSVTIGGQPAFVDYISPTQVNVQVPSSAPTGTQSVIVTSPGGVSTPYSVTVNATQPGLLAPTSFIVGGTQYSAAIFSDGATYAIPPGAIAGLASRRAQPGDTLTLYGIGFGSVAPSIPAGQVVSQSNTLALALQVKIGGVAANVTYDGLAPSAVGLYQINVVVPSIPSSDATPLTFTLGGASGTQTLYLAVQGTAVAPAVRSVTLSASSVTAGGTAQGTVTLTAPAPAGGAIVSLSSNSSAATVAATVTVPAGSLSATFSISAASVTSTASATISASYGGGTASAVLSVLAVASQGPSFTSLVLEQDLFQPAGFPSTTIIATVTPDSGNNTYSAQLVGGGSTSISAQFVNGTASNQGNTFTFNNLFTLGGPLSNVFIVGTSYVITSGSLTFTLTPTRTLPSITTGNVSGMLTLVGTVYGGTTTITLSGPITGTYSEQ